MKEKVLAFYKSIYPHTYHIDDAAMDCHIKGGRELDAFMDAAKELLKEGRLSFIRKDVYAYNNDTEFIEGIYKGYRKSFGFVITAPDEEDVYVYIASVPLAWQDAYHFVILLLVSEVHQNLIFDFVRLRLR